MTTHTRSVLLLALAACHGKDDRPNKPADSPPIDTGTFPENARPLCLEGGPAPALADDLQAWTETFPDSRNRFFGRDELEELEALGDNVGDTPIARAQTLILRGWNRLKFGQIGDAIADFEGAEAAANSDELALWRGRARELLGAAWMRQAEVDNCLVNGMGAACIVPFADEALHHDTTGMDAAAIAFTNVLTQDQAGLVSVQWLLNVTYMARGRWPDDVPAEFRFPDDFLDSEGEADAWTNHMPAIGHTKLGNAGGASMNDFDGDGLLDLMVSDMTPTTGMDLYLNMGDGDFCVASNPSGVSAIPGILSFDTADYDNDGDLDVIAPRAAWQTSWGGVRVSLLRNDGLGHFTDVAVQAGLADPATDGPTQVARWADIDNDGWLDLFIGREDEESSPLLRSVSSLYRNLGDGTFEDIASSAGVSASGFVKGAAFFDYDRDGDPDLYVSSMKSADHLYENLGDLTFVDRAAELGIVEPIKSFPAAPFDYDQDGWTDLYVAAFTNNYAGGGPLDPTYFQSAEAFIDSKLGIPADPLYSETAHLYRNLGGTFEDVTDTMGLDDIHSTMGLSFGDFDMDGFPDLYLGTGAPEYDALEPNTAYRNDGGLGFLDVTTNARLGHLQKGHGVSFGDVDEDGDEDLLLDMGGAFPGDVTPNVVFANPSNPGTGAPRRHAVTLRLEGVQANRSAIGAEVQVFAGARVFRHTVGATGSFGSNSLQVEVALADEVAVDRVEILWPGDPAPEVLTGVPVDSIVAVRQGEGMISNRPLARFGIVEEEMSGMP